MKYWTRFFLFTAVVIVATTGGGAAAPSPLQAQLAAAAADSCGYPVGTTGRPGAVFNESTALRGFQLYGSGSSTRIAAFYSDEHAMVIGKSAPGFPVEPFTPSGTNHYDDASNPATGDPSASDPTGRPLRPALFLTDITANASDRSGDWQQQSNNSGAKSPSFVAGTWKDDVATDPAKNNWTLGPNADPVPAGLTNEGYGTEVVWNASSIGVIPGHTYRVQFMVHDGDQNKAGGDVGEGCATFTIPGTPPGPGANLAIEKHADRNHVNVGDDIGYLVTVTGSGPALGVTLNDPLPAGPANSGIRWVLDNVAGQVIPACQITGSVGSQVLSCSAVDLGTGADGLTPQSYSVHVTSPTNAGGTGFSIKNIATAVATNHGPVTDDDTAAGDTNPTGPGTGNTVVVAGQALLPARATPGAARLNGPTGCVARAFNARVRGTKIARVVFVLDGKRVKTVVNRANATTISLRIDPARFRIGVHRLVARVTFTSGSGTSPKTLTLSFQRCAKQLVQPRFTG